MELSLARVGERIDRFLFAPVDARAVAAMRISLGVLLLFAWVPLGAQFVTLFHVDGIVDAHLIDTYWTPYALRWLEGLSPEGLMGVYGLGIVAIVAFTTGTLTPVANGVVVVLLVLIHHRNPWIQNGGDRLIRIWALLMLVIPSGAAWSVDAWLRERLGWTSRATVPAFGLRLIQIQLVVMYTYTGLAKLGDSAWFSGEAIYYAISDGGFSRAPWLLDPIVQHPVARPFLWLLDLGTLAFEIGFLPLVLWSRTRNATLIAGIALHAGIFLTMAVGLFGPASVWGYQALAPWSQPRDSTGLRESKPMEARHERR
ncbi:MAG: HTTM domain-containing protein [Myxococcota bacterium]